MLIITIPMQSHAVKLDLPSTKTNVIDRNRNLVSIAANGQLNWNGNAVSDRKMSDLLAATAQLPVTPELHVRPDAKAPYAAVDKLLVMTKRAEVRQLGFVGNEAYARF
jgi:biopolymer transport protein ExbD